jgi:hypothetical protein
MKNTVLIDFVVELIKRFGSKSPKFFVILQYISAALTIITGIPELITFLNAEFGLTIIVPFKLEIFANKLVAWCSLVSWIIAKLTVDNPEETKLPFTKK